MGFVKNLLKKPFSPLNLAILLTLFFIVWLALGDKKSAKEEAPEPEDSQANSEFKVETRWSEATLQSRDIVTQGQVTPWQKVTLTARVGGRVERILVEQGQKVTAQTPLVKLSSEGRPERLEQAKALVKLRESELKSAKALEKSQFAPETELRQKESALALAKSELVNAELENQYTKAVAPFDGIADRRHVEPGQWVSPGDPLFEVVQIDTLRVTAYIPQQQVANVEIGQSVKLQLLDGRELSGEVSFVSFSANEQTRSYYIEVTADNPKRLRVAGASVTLRIQLLDVNAHQITPALLSLSEHGKLGVYGVDAQQTVVLYPVDVIAIDNNAAILSGLPDRFRLITLGAGFVKLGSKVETVEAK